MIKKLRLKFVLVFLVLVVTTIITSSCYASTPPTHVKFYSDLSNLSSYSTIELPEAPVAPDNFGYYLMFQFSTSNDTWKVNGASFGIKLIYIKNNYLQYLNYYIEHPSMFSKYGYDGLYMNYGNPESIFVVYNYDSNNNTWVNLDPTTVNFNYVGFVEYSNTFNWQKVISANYDIYAADNPDFCLYSTKTAIDTSFEYTLNGIKRGQVELKIDNLDSSLKMYGFVNFENTYNIGDILNTSTNIDNLRLLSMYSDNSDLSCNLYEGEKLTYYIVDENNTILDIGNINNLAEGYFLYGFPVSDGVDFVFLNDGQVYWNSDLSFKYQVDGGELRPNNNVVSISDSYFIGNDGKIAKITYNGFVYDSNDEVIATAVTSISNNLSSFYIKEINTNYYENNVGWNKSCYWLQSIVLAGTDSNGNGIDFSDYYIRWSIPTWLTVDSIEVGTSEYDKYNGVISGFSSNGVLSIQLKIYELLKNHTKPFDITLQIYDSDDNLLSTHVINSDDIVRNQVLSEENNIDKPSYDIIDNPNYTGGSGNKDFSNIQNWTSDDYLNLMSTDNFIWEFFKAILGNLPWWITVPFTILIFGVVIITLIRFARGA